MSYKPLISLIMPLYNHERFVNRAITSIVNQTYTNWELIVIDDGSTDRSAEIVKSFNDSRISYFYQENQGVLNLAKTINRGLEIAKGEMVTMMPSDDTWPENRFSIQVEEMSDEDVILSFGKMSLVNEMDNEIGFANPSKSSTVLSNLPVGIILKYLLVNNFIGEPTILIRTKPLKEIGGYQQPNGMLAEDYPTTLHLACKGRFKFIDETLANYRFHSSQMTRLHIVDMVTKEREFVLDFFNNLSEEFKDITGYSASSLDKAWNEKIARSYFSLGRRLAFNNDMKRSRENFFLSFKNTSSWKIKAASVLAIISTLIGINIEWMRIFSPDTLKLEI